MSRRTTYALAVGIVLGASATGLVSAVRAAPPATEVRAVDQVISFIVDGREVARIDASGLMVNGAIIHSGPLTNMNGTPAIPAQDGGR